MVVTAFAITVVAACADGSGNTNDAAPDGLERIESPEKDVSVLAPEGWRIVQAQPRFLLLGPGGTELEEAAQELRIIWGPKPSEVHDLDDLSQTLEPLQPVERRDEREVAGQPAAISVFLGIGTKELRANFLYGDDLWTVSLLFDPSKAADVDALWDAILDSLLVIAP